MKSKLNQSFYAYLDWYLYLIYSTQNLTQIRFSFSWLNHIEVALLNSAEIMQENANSSTYFFSKANLYICTERAVDSLETYYRFLNIFHLKFGQSNAYLIKHDRQEGLRESKVVQFWLHVQLEVSHGGYRLYHYSTEEMLVKTHNSSLFESMNGQTVL